MTMAVVAVLVATVSLLGHRAHTEEILLQNKTTDTWAYYQAKNLRLNNLQALNDVMSALEGKNEKAEQVQKRFESNIEKYSEEKTEIQNEAHALGGRAETAKPSAPTASISPRCFWRSRWWSPRSPC